MFLWSDYRWRRDGAASECVRACARVRVLDTPFNLPQRGACHCRLPEGLWGQWVGRGGGGVLGGVGA